MRFAAILAFIGLGLTAASADPVADYLADRDRYVAAFGTHAPDGVEEEKALADLERLLAAAVPSWRALGFSAKGRINLDTLVPKSLGFGVLDGVNYKSDGTTVLVTSVPLVKRWLKDNHHPPSGNETIPLGVSEALRSGTFYSWAIAVDATAVFYGNVPVTSPQSRPFVRLVTFAQDFVLDAGPSELLVSVIRGDRVFIAEKAITIKPFPDCKRRLDTLVARADALPAKNSSGPHSPYIRMLDRADKGYRRCFIANMAKAPEWVSLKQQAQALVDLLH